jgi:hypothetical protein
MPITNITIENFKGVGSKVSIPLRPITLLFGANSAGKSTILQAMLYMRELLERQNADVDVLLGCSDIINLGGFRELVHNHDLGRKVRIGVTMTVDDDGLPEYPIAHAENGEQLDFQTGSATFPEAVKTVGICLEVENHPIQGPWISTYTVEINDAVQGSITCQPGEAAKIIIQPESCLCNLLLGRLDSEFYESEEQEGEENPDIEEDSEEANGPIDPNRQAILKELVEKMLEYEKHKSAAESLGNELMLSGEFFEYGGGVIPNFESGIKSLSVPAAISESELIHSSYHRILSQVFAGSGKLILNELNRIRYIGPIRKIPSRNFSATRSISLDRWADGSAAWDILHKSSVEPDWLNKRQISELNLGYRIQIYRHIEIPCETVLGGAIESVMLGVGTESFDLDVIPSVEFKKLAVRSRLRLLTEETEIEVAPADIGVGISQVLPIVIGAMAPGYSILSVEQPELHIHPAIQCRLADLLAHQALCNDERMMLLETHSEHLILRLLRRVRELNEGNLQPGDPEVRPQDLSILYVTSLPEGLEITELPVTEDGDFAREWPRGFFGERFEEYPD